MKFLVEVEVADGYTCEKPQTIIRHIEEAIGDCFVNWYLKTLKITEVKDV